MNRKDYFTVAGDTAIALACLALLSLAAVLYATCKKKCTVDPDIDCYTSTTLMLPAHAHQLSEIESATDRFHGSRIIGKGRHGIVYRAISASGDAFTVKRVHHHLVLGNPGVSLSSRIKLLCYANHPNVISILGFAEAPGERLILSEFAGETKSLEHHLCHSCLSWDLRLRIAAGAARGIQHLHEGSVPGIVHGCLKPSNILVDENLCARICDYGLCFLVGPGSDRREMAGYVDWESGGGACKENDVYGFGVVLFELLSGRRCEGRKLVEWALAVVREGRLREVFDERVAQPRDERPLIRMAKVAAACVGNGRKTRPGIAQVAAILSNLEAEISA